mgnify:CR=1 FL=1
MLGGVMSVEAKGKRILEDHWTAEELYKEQPPELKDVTLKAVPYCYWGNRKTGGDGSLDQTADLTEKHVSHGRSSENRRYFRSDKEKHLGGKCMKKKGFSSINVCSNDSWNACRMWR